MMKSVVLPVAFNQMTGKLRQTLEGLENNLRELKQKDDALQKSEHKYRTLVENIPQNIFRKDLNSVFISCNENFASTLNLRPEDISRKDRFRFLSPRTCRKIPG